MTKEQYSIKINCRVDRAKISEEIVKKGKEVEMKEVLGYKSAKIAEAIARRKNEVGLTGPGQQCGPVELPDGSFGFWTAHDFWGEEPYGKVILPGKKYIPGEIWRAYALKYYVELEVRE